MRADYRSRPSNSWVRYYGIRSERQLMEQLNYNLPFRWD
jgi:hypothetical protein